MIDRVEVSESLYKKLLRMKELNKKSVAYNELFIGIKIVLNKDIKQGYKIFYKTSNNKGGYMSILENARRLKEIADEIAKEKHITVQEAWNEALEKLNEELKEREENNID